MMHVAIICKTFLKGGAEKQALILTKLLVDKGIDVILINWYGEKVDQRNLKYINDNSFRYYPMNGSYLKKLNKLQKIIKNDETSIIISYLTLANFVSGLSKIFNRNIVTIGGIRNEKLPYYKFLFEKLIHNYLNDATVFNSYSAKAKFERRGFNPEKIYVIQNAIESKNLQVNSKTSNGEIRIVTVGRFVKQKDYETALKSFSNLIERNRDKEFKYYIVGYGPLESEVRSLAEQLKIGNKIKFFINPPDIPGILRNSDIFLSTSLFEGVSNSIMEALVAGLPVVATNVGDNSYLIKNGHNGYLVPCKDINTIVDKLEYLSGSEEVRNEFGKNSIKVVETEFSKIKLLDNYLSLFSKLQ
jgi:glycosyltransferase involved in cell wall biosynthesis